MDYNTLIAAKTTPGSISAWTNNSQIQGEAPNIVQEAQLAIQTRLRHYLMLTPPQAGTMTAASSPPTTGQDQIALPTSPAWLDFHAFWITGIYKRRLPLRTEAEVFMAWNYDGNGNRVPQQPQFCYVNQSYIQLDSPPDLAYPYILTYFTQIPTLTVGSPTNWLTNNYPRLFRAFMMAYASEWAKDNGQGNYDRMYWDQVAEAELDKAQSESDRAMRATEGGMIFVGGGEYDFPAYSRWS